MNYNFPKAKWIILAWAKRNENLLAVFAILMYFLIGIITGVVLTLDYIK